MTEFRTDSNAPTAPFPHVWETCVGSGHATMALRRDWLDQLKRCRRELGVQAVRFHGILSDDVGTWSGPPEHPDSFYNAFQIFDGILEAGVRPFVELSFMPRSLARGGATVFSYDGVITPPEDPEAWAELVRRFTSELVRRYGAEEVRQWHFEVWNEPNLRAFWTGTQQEYFDLYRWAVQAIKSVDPDIPVGGPATADNEWIEEMVAYAEGAGVPLDFVTTHQYPTDAFGAPGDDTEKQLSKGQRGVMRERALDVAAQAAGRPVFYTEWNTSSNPRFWRHDAPYAAAFAAKACLDVVGVVEGFSYWTFSDLFEELNFSSVPFHGGFGLLTVQGIAKPTYRAFQLMHGLGDERFVVDGMHPTVDCTVTRRGDDIVAFLTNHALPGHPIADADVCLRLGDSAEGAGAESDATVERVDADHANARRAWEAMGEPSYPDPDQLDQLHRASEVDPETVATDRDGADLTVSFPLPAHAVARVTVPGAARHLRP